jgi:hypothetical protein
MLTTAFFLVKPFLCRKSSKKSEACEAGRDD